MGINFGRITASIKAKLDERAARKAEDAAYQKELRKAMREERIKQVPNIARAEVRREIKDIEKGQKKGGTWGNIAITAANMNANLEKQFALPGMGGSKAKGGGGMFDMGLAPNPDFFALPGMKKPKMKKRR